MKRLEDRFIALIVAILCLASTQAAEHFVCDSGWIDRAGQTLKRFLCGGKQVATTESDSDAG